MGKLEAYERILTSLHEAALDDTSWSTASALIDDALHVHGNGLVLVDLHSPEDIQIYFLGFFYHGQRNRDGNAYTTRSITPGRAGPPRAANARQPTDPSDRLVLRA